MIKTITVLSLLLILSGCSYVSDDANTQPADKPFANCRMRDFTVEYLQGISDDGNIDYEISQEYADELNSIPLCKDLCKKQLEYSKKYDDWFAEDDLRETCKSIGIILPE